MACKSKQPADTQQEPEAGTPVTITNIEIGPIAETVELNATAAFLLKNSVKSTTNGYLQSVNTAFGKYVKSGQELFVIKTKEAETLGNIMNELDTTLQFNGLIRIKAPLSGYVTQLDYEPGNYVQDGEQLAIISDVKNFAFLLDLPYELKPLLSQNRTVDLELPDGQRLRGTISAALPTVDPVSQTQRYQIKVNTTSLIPENLIAKVKLIRHTKPTAVLLPKEAVLTDETQHEFWIMQLTDDSTAVRVLIQKGIETKEKVEVLTPHLSTADRILLTGNYGLPDTAKVRINH